MNPLIPVLLASIAIGAAAAILAWRERPEPGATPLAALLAAQCWWSTCIVFQLRADSVGSLVRWTHLGWFGVVVIPVTWLLFALEYTGRDEYVRPRYVALLSVVPVATVLLALTGAYHDLLYVRVETFGPTGVDGLPQGGPWFWVIAGYTYLLGGLGVVLLLGLIRSEVVTFRGQGATLLVGLLVPWVTNVLFLTGVLPTSGVDPTPIAFSISGVTYLGALTRFRLLGTNPAPNKRARRYAIDRMREGAVVVDSNDFVVDVNDSCVDMLGADASDVLGARAGDVIPEYERFPDDGTLPGHLTVGDGTGGQPYDVTVTRITNVRDTVIGRVITFHDVGKHVRQQQRMEVLNRVLRHDIRTETNIIYGYVEQFADDESAGIVKDRAMRIEEIGRKGREAIELFDETNEERDPRSVDSLLERCVASVREAYPAVTITYDPPDPDVAVAGLLEQVFSNVIENAAEHNDGDDPHVWIRGRAEDGRVHVDVADDGPGIDEYEVKVLADGVESPLKHGSGLGLWIAKWGTDIADGEIHFAENDPTGSVVTVSVPRLEESAPDTA